MENIEAVKMLAMAFTIAIGAVWPAIAIMGIGKSALQAVGRNPEASSKIQGLAVFGMAFAEAIAIYALVVALIIGFAL